MTTTVLEALEFKDCLLDSPFFRETLHSHEKVLDVTSRQLKQIVREIKDLLDAANKLSQAQRSLSHSLKTFEFVNLSVTPTDDENLIHNSFKEFGNLIDKIEDVRDKVLEAASEQIIQPLEKFRKENIGGVKEGKKKFEKQTAKFCQNQERYLNMSTKKLDSHVKEADATLDMEERELCQASLHYVFKLQEVEEQKKIEIVERISSFLITWFGFYHQGHEVYQCEFEPQFKNLLLSIQKTRDNFVAARDQAESLMNKMLEVRQQKPLDPNVIKSKYTKEGYLFLMEKKAFGTTWTKQYCRYQKDTKEFEMIQYHQMSSKGIPTSEKIKIASCTRRLSDSIEKRFCFDLVAADRPGAVFTLQALSDDDRKLWMDAMDGKEPIYAVPGNTNKVEERPLDEIGFQFVRRCIEALESRGLEEQGLYRVVGVSSKVNKLLTMGLDRRKSDKMPNLDDRLEWESKTITSALKAYLSHLPKPLMTFLLHEHFIEAAKKNSNVLRVNSVHHLVHNLPKPNFQMLDILINHLKNVSMKSDKNLMSVSNLGVCFGPTLLRPEEETVAAIMNIKFCNIVVEILINNYERIFKTVPEQGEPLLDQRLLHSIAIREGNGKFGPYGHANKFGSLSPIPAPVILRAPPRHQYINQNPVTHAVAKTVYSEGPTPVSLSSSLNNMPSNFKERDFNYGQDQFFGDGGTYLATPTTAFSDGNLHHVSHNSHMPYKFNRTTTTSSSVEPLNNTSSSNESVSSAVDTMYPPSKLNKEATRAKDKLGVHPIPPYRSYGDNVVPFNYPSSNFHSNAESSTTESAERLGVRRVRTLYACLGENDGELSFEPNQIITNVRPSIEPGWLEGSLNGKTGLIPENYVEILP